MNLPSTLPGFRTLTACLTIVAALQQPALVAASLATNQTKFIGSAYSSAQAPNFTAYFNQVTPENASKWGVVEGTRNVMNWAELDAAYKFAKSHGLPFKFHTLIWGNQQPGWIDALPPEQQLVEIKEWISQAAARYPDTDLIDVVNEPIHAPPSAVFPPGGTTRTANYIAALGGAGATGYDWVLTAFRLAREAFPHAKLLVNEYSVTNDASTAQKYVQIINLLKAENLIDGVGIQGHAFETFYVSAPTTATNLNTIAAAGVPIYVTEFDIDGPTDQAQLEGYQKFFPVFWENAGVAGFTFWGWRPGLWRSTANLVLSDGTERPALQWLKTYLAGFVPAITANPQSQTVDVGGAATLTAAATASATPTYRWQRDGSDVAGATGAVLTLSNVQPADAGLYVAIATNVTGYARTAAAIVGVNITGRIVGTGEMVGENIPHPNGKFFDQVLVTGAAEAVTTAGGRVLRTSFIDLDNDIVQVEMSGPGTLSLVLDNAAAPAAPVNYNQATNYVKGHAGIVITGADENTNVSVFCVGRATAYDSTGAYNILLAPSATNDPAKNGSPLFVGHENTVYDGIADIAFIAVTSTNGKFGGIRASNANFFAAKGLTGVYAPGVALQGPLFIGNITASDDAIPVIQVGSVSDARITGGDLAQVNAKAVQVSGLMQLKFTDGSDAAGVILAARPNQAVLEQNGVNVTSQIVVNP